MSEAYAYLQEHVGRKIVRQDVATAYPVKALIQTLGRADTAPGEGEAIPNGWQGLYFLSTHAPEMLAVDGLATQSDILPEMPFPRRMFAGERLTFHRPIRVGDVLECESELTGITVKQGGTGTLAFATITNRISGPDGLCLEEARDGVFREQVPAGQKNPTPKRAAPPEDTRWRREVQVDPVLLFRYSALTFNGHRIHYDRPYATETEGYPGLVIHGPLLSTYLVNFARDSAGGRELASFHMRARAPLFDIAPFATVGRPNGDDAADIWAVTPEGTIAMSASVTYA